MINKLQSVYILLTAGWLSTNIHPLNPSTYRRHLPSSHEAIFSQESFGLIFFMKSKNPHRAKSGKDTVLPVRYLPSLPCGKYPDRVVNARSTSFHAASRSSPCNSISSNFLPNRVSIRARKSFWSAGGFTLRLSTNQSEGECFITLCWRKVSKAR